MSNDLSEYAVRDQYRSEPTWSGGRFTLRCTAATSNRTGFLVGFGSWGMLLTLTSAMLLIEDGFAQRGAFIGVGLFLLGLFLLFLAARGAKNSVAIEGDADEILIRRAPLPPFGARRVAVADVEEVVVQRRPVRWTDHVANRRTPNPLAMPFHIALELRDGDRVLVPVGMTHVEASQLAIDLRRALDEAKVRRAEAGGFRG